MHIPARCGGAWGGGCGEKRRTKAIWSGVVLAGLGLVLVWSGLTPLSQNRDADGYFRSDSLTIELPSRAVVSYDVGLLRGHYECAAEEAFFLNFYSPDDVRMQAVGSGSDGLFVGIAPARAVEGYLDGVTHDEITEWDCDVDDITPVEYETREGATVPDAPDTKQYWVASESGTGELTLDWTIESGEWAVVIMNADASNGISADLRFGALAPSSLDTLAWTSFAAGLIALIGGGWLLVLGFRRTSRDTAPQPTRTSR